MSTQPFYRRPKHSRRWNRLAFWTSATLFFGVSFMCFFVLAVFFLGVSSGVGAAVMAAVGAALVAYPLGVEHWRDVREHEDRSNERT